MASHSWTGLNPVTGVANTALLFSLADFSFVASTEGFKIEGRIIIMCKHVFDLWSQSINYEPSCVGAAFLFEFVLVRESLALLK